jgi:sugar phosphate isomerase/epimerase
MTFEIHSGGGNTMRPKFAFTVNTPETRKKSLSWSGDMEMIFGRLREFGYDGVELFVRNPRELDVERIKRFLSENGLQAAAVGTGPIVAEDKLFLSHENSDVRSAAVARGKAVVDFAAALDCQMNIGKFRGDIGGDSRRKAWMDEGMREIAAYAQERKVIVTIEPQSRLGCDNSNTTQQCLAWIRELDMTNIRIMLDVFHMQIEDVNIPASFIDAAALLFHVHFADTNRECPGMGSIDFATVLHILRALRYEGFISMEMKQTPDSARAAKRAIDYASVLASFVWA